MKTKEELNALKNEVDALNAKLTELNEDELKEVTGGYDVVAPGLPGIPEGNVEVGKWYIKADDIGGHAEVLTFLTSPTQYFYCAEHLGGNKFRFECWFQMLTADGGTVTRGGDFNLPGIGFVEDPGPIPRPR